MFHKAKQHPKVAVLLVVLLAAIVAASAYAYFVNTGTGSSQTTVPVGSPGTTPLTVTSSYQDSALVPGGGGDVRVVIANNTTNAVLIGGISGSVANVPAGCDPSWFSVATVRHDAVLAANESIAKMARISFADSGTNQNACAGAQLRVTSTLIP